MRRFNRFAAASIALLLSYPVFSHHAEIYVREIPDVVEGVVTRFNFVNPHTYVFVESSDENGETVEYEFGSLPPGILARRGWSRNSLQVGDRVRVENKVITKEDGTILDMNRLGVFGNPQPTVSTSEIWGQWEGIFSLTSYRGFFNNLPLTEKGRAAETQPLNHDARPLNNCQAIPAPRSIGLHEIKVFEDHGDQITIRHQLGERTIHMDGRSHPDDGELFEQGHSVGHWEDGVLVIDTTLFAPHLWGTTEGVPSGPGKRLVERYSLSDDGTRMHVEFTVEDPEYLTEPASHRAELVYVPQYSAEEVAADHAECDLTVSKYFLNEKN